MIALWLLLSCGGPEPEPVVEDGVQLEPLDDVLLVRRLSIDLRGVLPSAEELDAVEADPDQVDALRDAFLADERLDDRLVHMWAERWHTLLEDFEVQHWDYHLDDELEFTFDRSVGEEPLRLMAHVAVQDDPWTDIVTADYTMSNETLAGVWPLERTDGEGWQPSWYTDGRPPRGRALHQRAVVALRHQCLQPEPGPRGRHLAPAAV